MIVGIDLGTTYSAVAVMESGGPRLIPNSLGELLTPSVVAVEPQGTVLVGRAARELQVVSPERAESLFKRNMGNDWSRQLGTREFTPERLSSLVLRSLKEDAEADLGAPVNRAVITVPAYFNEHQRRATINAGQLAGLEVDRILNEPTAAAIAYGLHEAEAEKVIVVIDLGGGTFDVSVVELFQGALEVRSSCGECFLGGEDFTSAVAARVLESRGYVFERAEFEHPQMVSRLRQICEVAKRQLSSRDRFDIRIPDELGALPEAGDQQTVTREDLESWTKHILQRIETPIRRALGDAQLKRSDIDEVILVGGATRMPMLIERVRQTFGCTPRCSMNPDEVVALGAGVQAGLIAKRQELEDLVVTDVAPFTLGIEYSKEFGTEHRAGYFLPIINRNTTIPASRFHRVSTVRANQSQIQVKIYQGENRMVEGNLFLGEFTVDGIPLGPRGQSVEIRFTYDLNGVLEAEATIVETQRTFTHLVTRHASGLSPEEIAQAVEQMQELKTHPRENAENRFLIRRAERVYQELSLELRHELDDLLGGFEEVLEIGEEDAIDRFRAEMAAFLDRYDSESSDSNHDDW